MKDERWRDTRWKIEEMYRMKKIHKEIHQKTRENVIWIRIQTKQKNRTVGDSDSDWKRKKIVVKKDSIQGDNVRDWERDGRRETKMEKVRGGGP